MSLIDIIVVGAGPAGMTAALYALRANKTVIVIEKETIGGQIAQSPRLENYPSIVSISGNEFADQLFEQISDLGANLEIDEILSIEKKEDYFILQGDSDTYYAKAVILATGVKHRIIGAINEENLIGSGISYCATCDGPFFKGQEVAVIGDANSALQYTIALAGYCSKVYICTLFDHFFGDQQLVDRIKELNNVEIIHNVSLKEFIGNESLEALRFENTNSKEELILKVNGVFVAIGQVPNNEAFNNLVDLDEKGYFNSNESCLTKTEGLFVAGDCRVKSVRQVATAISDGAVAATLAVEYINRK